MSSCKRCGQCRRLGGPVSHRDDLSPLDRLDAPAKGTVPFGMADLVMLRTGEPARDDVIGTLTPPESKCMRLAPARDRTDWECRFLARMPDAVPGRDTGCGICDRRPAQCRALNCPDTRGIARLYDHNRVSRADVMRAVGVSEEWLGLFPAYEEMCAHSRIASLAKLATPPISPGTLAEKEATEALPETVCYDISFRQLYVERGNIPEGCLLFLLGRPLSGTPVMFGLALTRNNNRMGLARRGEGRYGGPMLSDGRGLYG